jgi:hypothetical protein
MEMMDSAAATRLARQQDLRNYVDNVKKARAVSAPARRVRGFGDVAHNSGVDWVSVCARTLSEMIRVFDVNLCVCVCVTIVVPAENKEGEGHQHRAFSQAVPERVGRTDLALVDRDNE